MAIFRAQRRVEFRDTDAAGIMHFSAFFPYMEQVEHAFLRSLGTSVVQPLPDQGKLSWPRVAATCDFRAPLRFEQTFDCALTIAKLGRTSVVYRHLFECDGVRCAEGSITAVYCRMLPGQPASPEPIPAELRERMSPFLDAE